MEVRVTRRNFENWPIKDHPSPVCFKLAYWFQRRRFLSVFPIGSYVKTMSAEGGHLGWRSGSLDIILKVDNLRTIHAMFYSNWLTSFRGEDLNISLVWSYVKTMSADGGHFGPRSGSLNTILEVDHLRNIDDMFAILAYWFQRRRF
jgi:hypothetical protein